MSRSPARGAALTALVTIEEGLFLEPALAESDSRCGDDDRERRLSRRMVRGALKSRGRIDWIIGRLLHRGGVESLDIWTRNILRLGVYQITSMSSIPSHAAVNESVRLARARGGQRASGLVNALLRRLLREGIPGGIPSIDENPVGHLAVQESYPEWLVARWVKRLGVEQATERLRAGNRTPPLALRILREGRIRDVVASLEGAGLSPRRSALDKAVLLIDEGVAPGSLAALQRGDVIVQDEAAALVTRLAEPVDRLGSILDLCAAPGGKIISIACEAGPGTPAVASDLSLRRIARLRKNLETAGLGWIDVVCADGKRPPFEAQFGAVLVDAPCTGLGTTARKADLRWRVAENDIQRLANLALDLLRSAAERLEPGGLLIYSTCTTEPEENEDVVGRFLEADWRFRIEPPGDPMPVEAIAPDGTMRLLPEIHRCDGAFGVRLRKGLA